MPAKEDPQTQIDEEVIEDEGLLALLRDEKDKKDRLSEETARVKTAFGQPAADATEAADVALRAKELDESGVYRCGNFRLTPEKSGGKKVAYTTTEKMKVKREAIGQED